MDSQTSIIGVAILLLVIMPVIVLNKTRKSGKNKFIQTLKNLAESNSAAITQSDIWYQSGIGIDVNSKKLFFIKKTSLAEVNLVVNLDEVQKCRIVKTKTSANTKEGNIELIDKLELAFNFTDKRKNEIALEFFNAEPEGLLLNDELQLIEKWYNIIQQHIPQINPKK